MLAPFVKWLKNMEVYPYTLKVYFTLSYIVFRLAQSEPSSGVKGKAISNKNLSN